MASYIQIMVDSCFSIHSSEGIFLQMNVKNYARTIDHVKKLDLGPVVPSIISLTSTLRGQLVKCFATFQHNTQIYFC